MWTNLVLLAAAMLLRLYVPNGPVLPRILTLTVGILLGVVFCRALPVLVTIDR